MKKRIYFSKIEVLLIATLLAMITLAFRVCAFGEDLPNYNIQFPGSVILKTPSPNSQTSRNLFSSYDLSSRQRLLNAFYTRAKLPLKESQQVCAENRYLQGTGFPWAVSLQQAQTQATTQNKLIYLMQLAGNPEIPGYT